MPLDHFVPKIYLSKWASPELSDGRLFAIKKACGSLFTPQPKGICAVHDGSTNKYLAEERIFEEVVQAVEHNINAAVERLSNKEITPEDIITVSLAVACISSISPTNLRLFGPALKEIAAITTEGLEKSGAVPPLEGKTLTELLHAGKFQLKVDGKYSQAFSISSLNSVAGELAAAEWELLINETVESPFFTSDYPIGLEMAQHPAMRHKIFPLSPRAAVRIKPTLDDPRVKPRFLNGKKCVIKKLNRAEVVKINQALVQSAESLILFQSRFEWIKPFVNKHRKFRIEMVNQTFDHPDRRGKTLISAQMIVPHDSNATVINRTGWY